MKQGIASLQSSKKTDWLLGVKILWLLSLISLIIVVLLNAISLNNLIFTWLFFATGAFYLLRYFREKTRNNRAQTTDIRA
jgi:positive regulator of sigma E activity